MDIERKLVEYIQDTEYEDLPEKPIRVTKDVILNDLGAIIGGATVAGCPEMVDLVRQ